MPHNIVTLDVTYVIKAENFILIHNFSTIWNILLINPYQLTPGSMTSLPQKKIASYDFFTTGAYMFHKHIFSFFFQQIVVWMLLDPILYWRLQRRRPLLSKLQAHTRKTQQSVKYMQTLLLLTVNYQPPPVSL